MISEDNIGGVAANFKGQLEDIKRNLEALQLQLFEKKRVLESETYQCQREQGNVGRPRFIISREQILYLREFSFKWTEIADILGVSISTLNQHQASLGLGSEPRFTAIADDDLDTLVCWGDQHLVEFVSFKGRWRIGESMSRDSV